MEKTIVRLSAVLLSLCKSYKEASGLVSKYTGAMVAVAVQAWKECEKHEGIVKAMRIKWCEAAGCDYQNTDRLVRLYQTKGGKLLVDTVGGSKVAILASRLVDAVTAEKPVEVNIAGKVFTIDKEIPSDLVKRVSSNLAPCSALRSGLKVAKGTTPVVKVGSAGTAGKAVGVSESTEREAGPMESQEDILRHVLSLLPRMNAETLARLAGAVQAISKQRVKGSVKPVPVPVAK